MANHVDVNPELLRWAIDRSGRTVREFSEPVDAWLNAGKSPTLRQLESFARRAMVPLGYLFLQSPPEEDLPVPDYRTRAGESVRRPSAALLQTIFQMQRRQLWMREYLLEEGHDALPFVGSSTVGDNTVELAQHIRSTLGLSPDWAGKHSKMDTVLRELRSRVEAAGILIFANGVVGNSTKHPLDAAEFQGFVLVDHVAPLIFINNADVKVAQAFTIAHELVHIWVGQSALFAFDETGSPDIEVEQYCNSVAAELLVPANSLKAQWPMKSFRDDAVVALGRRFKVSPIVVARRAKDIGLITDESFFDFYDRYQNRDRSGEKTQRSGGDFWLNQNVRVGARFGRAVISAVREGRVSYSTAYDLTQLYGDTFEKFATRLDRKG